MGLKIEMLTFLLAEKYFILKRFNSFCLKFFEVWFLKKYEFTIL